MVLVVLVLVWAVVLGPSLFRRTKDRHAKDSIGSFHRQLNVLRRTGPSLVAPAYRLDVSAPADDERPADPGWLTSVSSRPAPAAAMRLSPPDPGAAMARRRSDPYFRPGATKRRRDVLMVLLSVLTVSGLIGLIPSLHILLAATGFVGIMLVAYVGLLVRLRNQAHERETKLRYLPRAYDDEPPVLIRRAASR